MLPLLQTAPAATSSYTMWYPTFLRFLISYDFYSKLGFLISYTVTSLLVLEVLRLVYTDANKREVEKMIDSYTTAKTSPRPERKTRRIPLDELEKRPKMSSRRKSVSPAMSPDSERTLVGDEERKRRKRAQSLVTLIQPLPQTQSQTQTQTTVPAPQPPTRRLRKRSDTVISNSSSSESRKLERRRRDASPASLASSKASSRGGSPKPRKVKERDALQMSAMMSKVLRQKV